jgi:hypothetical protein
MLWALLAWLLAFVAFVVGTTVVALWGTRKHPGMSVEDLAAFHQAHQGTVQSVAALLRGVLLLAVSFLAVAQRRGLRRHHAMPWRWPSRRGWAGALLSGVGVALVCSAAARTLGVTPSVVAWWNGADSAVLAVAGMLLASVGEEVFFRGVMFLGVRHARFCGWGAGVMAGLWWGTLYWAADAWTLASLFLVGLLLGWERARSGTLWTGLGLRLVATVAVVFLA